MLLQHVAKIIVCVKRTKSSLKIIENNNNNYQNKLCIQTKKPQKIVVATCCLEKIVLSILLKKN